MDVFQDWSFPEIPSIDQVDESSRGRRMNKERMKLDSQIIDRVDGQ